MIGCWRSSNGAVAVAIRPRILTAACADTCATAVLRHKRPHSTVAARPKATPPRIGLLPDHETAMLVANGAPRLRTVPSNATHNHLCGRSKQQQQSSRFHQFLREQRRHAQRVRRRTSMPRQQYQGDICPRNPEIRTNTHVDMAAAISAITTGDAAISSCWRVQPQESTADLGCCMPSSVWAHQQGIFVTDGDEGDTMMSQDQDGAVGDDGSMDADCRVTEVQQLLLSLQRHRQPCV